MKWVMALPQLQYLVINNIKYIILDCHIIIFLFLASELLREAEKLIEQKIHPQIIISGWRSAVEVARKALEDAASDNSTNEALFKEDLLNIARTTLSSKILCQHKE